MILKGLALTAAWLLASPALLSPINGQAPSATEGWHRFEGTWSAAGRRHTLPTEGSRAAAIVQLSGAVVLEVADGLSRGFRGEIIGFDDGLERSVGRWVWTDERGDRIFGQIAGEPMRTGRRFVGTITGGSGRYAELSGEYELTWQYVAIAGDEEVQGRTVDLRGRYRRGAIQP